MPNMVANRLTIEGENSKELIMSLLTFDECGDEADFDFNKVIKMPKSVKDKTEWAKKKWGCKDNALYTEVDIESGTIDFQTPWTHCLPVIEKLSALHPDAKFTYQYSVEEAGYNVGYYIFMNGSLAIVVEMEPFTKEAFEQHFSLWGKDDSFVYDEKLDNYFPKTKKLNLKVYELVDSLGHKLFLYPIIRKYQSNGRLAIELVDEDYDLLTFLTVNLQYDLSDNNDKLLAFVDTNNNKWAEEFIEHNKLGKRTGYYGMSGYCVYPEYRFNTEMLNEDVENG